MNRTLQVLLVALVALCGCSAVPLAELGPEDMTVSILPTSTRIFQPGRASSFDLAITNQTSRAVSFDELRIELSASPAGALERRDLSQTWTYKLGEPVVLSSGKTFRFPLRPEPIEFRMEQLLPGNYVLRATAFGRYTSKPFEVRVLRPDLPGGKRS